MQTSTPLVYGEYYHIYNRGNNRQSIFFEEQNYHYFLKLYVKYIVPVADTYAYCLMNNHFHFLVRIKTVEEQTNKTAEQIRTAEVSKTSAALKQQTAEVSKTSAVSVSVLKPNLQFGHLLNSYAKAINKTYQRAGSLFQSRFGRIRVDTDRYLMQLVTYIHQNPQKHGFVDDFRVYPYSSYPAIRYQKASRINTAEVLAWFGGLDAFEQCHRLPAPEKEIEHLLVDDFF
jgi:REP element-mobilizing transposase RayT